MRRLVVFVLLVSCGLAGAVASCSQGEGDRCQVNSDCGGGLVCNQATSTCQSTTSGADGNISPDAAVDGGPQDAAIDAEPIDAEFDASPIDAN